MCVCFPLCISFFVHVCAFHCAVLQCSSACTCLCIPPCSLCVVLTMHTHVCPSVYSVCVVLSVHMRVPPSVCSMCTPRLACAWQTLPYSSEKTKESVDIMSVSECGEDDSSDQGMECVTVTCDPMCVNSTFSPDSHVPASPLCPVPLGLTLRCPDLTPAFGPVSHPHPFLCPCIP